MGMSEQAHRLLQLRKLAQARRAGADVYYELGVTYSLGQRGIDIDLVEAHKWFNLAAMAGMRAAQEDRAAVAADMSNAEVAEAQRQARAWLAVERTAA